MKKAQIPTNQNVVRRERRCLNIFRKQTAMAMATDNHNADN